MRVHVCTPRTTRDIRRTYEYNAAQAVWFFGPSIDEMAQHVAALKTGEPQGRSFKISPAPDQPEAHDLEKMQRLAQRSADHWRRLGFPTHVTLHEDRRGYHVHILVCSMREKKDARPERLHIDELANAKWMQRVKAIYNDPVMPHEPQRAKLLDRKGPRRNRAALYRKLEGRAVAELAKEPTDYAGTRRRELWRQMESDRGKLKKIDERIAKVGAEFQAQTDARRGAPAGGPIPSRPAGLTDAEWSVYQSALASGEPAPLHILIKIWAQALEQQRQNESFYFVPPELSANAESLRNLIRERRDIRARITEAEDERWKLYDEARVFALQQTRAFFGPLIIHAIKKDADGHAKNVKTYRVDTAEEAYNTTAQLGDLNNRGYHCYFTPEERERFAVFDDLSREQLYASIPRGAYIVRTSDDNYTAFLRFDRHITHAEMKALRDYVGSDPAANIQSSRVAGYVNHKRGSGFVVQKLSKTHKVFSADKMLRSIGYEPPTPPTPAPRVELPQQKKIKKTWEDFNRGDPSGADYSFALYLARRGASADQIAARLRAVSPDLEKRKRGHIDDYLTRTAAKALDTVATTGRKNRKSRSPRGFST